MTTNKKTSSNDGASLLDVLLQFLKNRGMTAKKMASVCAMTVPGFLRRVRQNDLSMSNITLLLNAAGASGRLIFYDAIEDLTLSRTDINSNTAANLVLTPKHLTSLTSYMQRHQITTSDLSEKTGLHCEQIDHMFLRDDARLSRLILLANQLGCHLLLDIHYEEDDIDFSPERPTFIIRTRLSHAESFMLASIETQDM